MAPGVVRSDYPVMMDRALAKPLIKKSSKSFLVIEEKLVRPPMAHQLLTLVDEVIPWQGGEVTKTRDSKAWLEDRLLSAGVDRQTLLIGCGGGALLDLVGFVAATLYRGLSLGLIPTTLLAMADACVGGKNGVDTPVGKNLIGTVYDPDWVLIEADWTETLPVELIRQGMAEMIKHAILFAPERLPILAKLAPHPPSLEEIRASVAMKCQVIRRSRSEPLYRDLLNFGHTVAHAIESASGYQISHGDAVAFGMRCEGWIAQERGFITSSDQEAYEETLDAWAYPAIEMEVEQALPYMCQDKKNQGGQATLALPDRTNEGPVAHRSIAVSKEELIAAWCLTAGLARPPSIVGTTFQRLL